MKKSKTPKNTVPENNTYIYCEKKMHWLSIKVCDAKKCKLRNSKHPCREYDNLKIEQPERSSLAPLEVEIIKARYKPAYNGFYYLEKEWEF